MQERQRPRPLMNKNGVERFKKSGLVVMGDDSRSRGRGFESWRHILDGHFFSLICFKNCIVCLKRPKINKKKAGVGPFF